jgi:hypothetical protein
VLAHHALRQCGDEEHEGAVHGRNVEMLARLLHPDRWPQQPPEGSVLKLVSPPAGSSSVENWAPRFEPALSP